MSNFTPNSTHVTDPVTDRGLKMKYFWMVFLCSAPLLAQVDRIELNSLIKDGKVDQAKAAVTKSCISFRPSEVDMVLYRDHPDLLLAMLQCLFDQIHGPAAVAATERPVTTPPVASPKATPALERPAPVISGGDPGALANAKIAQALNTLQLMENTEDHRLAVKNNIDAREVILGMVAQYGDLVSTDGVRAQLPEGRTLPDWVKSLVERGKSYKQNGPASLRFEAANRTDYLATPTEKRIHVYAGLYLLNLPDGESHPDQIRDNMIYSSAEYPVTYNMATSDFDFFKMESREVSRFRLKAFVNDKPVKQIFPGHWAFEIFAKNPEGRTKSRERYQFQIEAGKNYVLKMKWKTDRSGIRRMDFNLVEE